MSEVLQRLSFVKVSPAKDGEEFDYWSPGNPRKPTRAGQAMAHEFIEAIQSDPSTALVLPDIVSGMARPLAPVARAFLVELARHAALR